MYINHKHCCKHVAFDFFYSNSTSVHADPRITRDILGISWNTAIKYSSNHVAHSAPGGALAHLGIKNMMFTAVALVTL